MRESIRKQDLLTAICVTGLAGSAGAGLITWDNGGDGVSTFQEANWTAIDGAAGTNPPANAVNPNTSNAGGPGLIHDFLVGGSATAGGGGGASGNFDLTAGTTLTVQDDAVFRHNNSTGVRGTAAGGGVPRASVVATDNAFLRMQFSFDVDISLSDAADLEYNGGGNPVNQTTIDLAADWTGELRFLNEDVAATTAEHLSKITVNGTPAVIGTNVELVSNGGTGSILTVIPEPGSLALLALGGLAMGVRRRR